MLEKKGKVFITTESQIDAEFEKYQLKISPEKIHSLLYYATMLIGDSQTMTSEAAVLGTTAIKCNSFAGKLSVPNELESEFNLCYSYQPDMIEDFFEKIEELLANVNIKDLNKANMEKMIAEKIDVTSFFVWFIENYPKSKKMMLTNPNAYLLNL
jgi:predicted glycosyltransferase